MKFSILLPTRNRLALLKYAVETVLRQDYDAWEIIVSDNCSEEDVAAYISALGDDRIKYSRTETFLPVTDNWNNALAKSSGDYVIMLGDDDCLMKGCLTHIAKLVEQFDNPDFIHMRAFLYAYPGALPGAPDGLLRTNGCGRFFKSAKRPFLLSKKKAFGLVKQSMDFRLAFDYNMQYYVINRSLIDRLTNGPLFQSPYPDYYAANVLFLKANRILICPLPLVTIGISNKSFGFFYFNDREDQGVEFLKNLSDPEIAKRVQSIILSGTHSNTSWLLAMETIKSHYGSEYNLEVNYQRYRMIQILHVAERCEQNGGASKSSVENLWRELTPGEQSYYSRRLRMLFSLERRFKSPTVRRFIRKTMGFESPYPVFDPKRCERRFNNIVEVFEQVTPEHGLRFV